MKIVTSVPRSDKSCGTACLQAVLKYYGKMISQQELERDNLIREGLNYIYDIGYSALKQGFTVRIIGYDYLLFSNPEELDPLGFIQNSSLSGTARDNAEACLRYLEANGHLQVKIPTLKDIERYLNKNIPVIIGIRLKIIRGSSLAHTLHYVVVESHQNGQYILADPIGEKIAIPEDTLLYSWYSRVAQLLVIEPRRIRN